MMKATLKADHSNAVQTLLGDDVLIVKHSKSKVNSQLSIQSWLINYPEQQLPNQFGRLDCKLQEGGGVELMYLQHHFTELTSAVVYSISFSNTFLADWNQHTLLSEKAFSDNHSGLQVPFCNNSKLLLGELLDQPVAETFERSLRHMELALGLLRKATEHISKLADKYAVPACSFLANNSEREKVMLAREILEEEFEQTVTIKDLSRRVAINECYLKKGFKAMFGKTIHEFQQDLRINKAKRLLQTEGYTVSEVASILGYSSISHFSTAFKKATSMKPCELLK